jgi:gliding motility-associated-like protein
VWVNGTTLTATITTTGDTVYVPTTAGTYTAVVTTAAGCIDTTNAVTVSPLVKPALSINADTTTVCAGNTVTFTADATNAGSTPAYQWLLNGTATGANTTTYTSSALANGDAISCIVTGAPGCFAADTSGTITITVLPLPTAGPVNDVTIAPGQSVTLTMPVTGSIATYLWRPPYALSDTAVANPVATPTQTTTYTLTVTATDGCTATGTITVKMAYPISIPSAFTPNGDSKNDVFYVLGGYAGDKIKDFMIYNRMGQKIFEQHNVVPNDPAFGWDGTYQGVQQPPAAYVYFIVITAADGTQKMFKGTVVMVR